jgi:hypothetical protein
MYNQILLCSSRKIFFERLSARINFINILSTTIPLKLNLTQMTTTTVKSNEPAQKLEHTKDNSAENIKGIENHKKAAAHHEAAAKHHHEAAKHHEDGNHEKAYASTIAAHGHHALASDHQREDVKHHALKS